MPRRKQDTYQTRIDALKAAELSEYRRLILENQALIADIMALRREYGIRSTTDTDYMTWLDQQGMLVENAMISGELSGESYEVPLRLRGKLNAIAEKHGGAKYHKGLERGPLIELFKYGKFVTEGVFTKGHPFLIYKGLGPKLSSYYPPTFDPTNPILQQRAEALALIADPIPRPQATSNSRKKNWVPVWEWEKRHPNISRKEIAGQLGLNPVTVRRKLSELDAELSPD